MPAIPSLNRALAATRRTFLIPKVDKSKSSVKKGASFFRPRRASPVARAAFVDSDSDVSSSEARDFSPSPSPSPVASSVELPPAVEDISISSGDETDDEDEIVTPREVYEPHYAHPPPFEEYFAQPLCEAAEGLYNLLVAEEINKGYVERVGTVTRISVPAEAAIPIATGTAPTPAVVSAVPVAANSTVASPAAAHTAPTTFVAADAIAPVIMTPMGQALARVAERIIKPLPAKQGRAVTTRAVARMTEGVKQMTVDPAKASSVDDITRLLGVTDVDMVVDEPLSWGIEYQNIDWGHYTIGKRSRDHQDETTEDEADYSTDGNSSDDGHHGPALKRAKKWF